MSGAARSGRITMSKVRLQIGLGMILALVGVLMLAPAVAFAGTLTVNSDTDVKVIGVWNKAGGPDNYVDLTSSPFNAVRAAEPKPYPTGYADEPPEVTGSVWDLNVTWSFQTYAPGADWIWETQRAEDPATVYPPDHLLYDADASSNGRVVVFERAFTISGVPTSGTLRIAADNCYEVWINGVYVARSATAKVAEWEKSNLTEGFVGSTGWQTVGNYTGLETYLKSGENTIRILAGNEYYHPTNASFEFNNSPVPPYRESPYRQQNPGALIFTLGVGYKTLSIEASKWYDRDKDGIWDADEPCLEGWKLNLSKGEDNWCDLTDADGDAVFTGLGPGSYSLSEEPAPVGSSWVQTYPVGNLHEIALVDEDLSGYLFGNVCEKTTTGGYTMGFWSNKNGTKKLLDCCKTEEQIAEIQSLFRSAANASDMRVMLKAQLMATQLNIECWGTNYEGYGVVYEGEWVSIEDIITAAEALLEDHTADDRAEAEFYKDVFDGLNNNDYKVIPYDPCAVPTFTCD